MHYNIDVSGWWNQSMCSGIIQDCIPVNRTTFFIEPAYLCLNSAYNILLGKPFLQIRMPSSTPLHWSWFNTKSASICPGSLFSLGMIQRTKWGWVLYKFFISLFRDSWNERNINHHSHTELDTRCKTGRTLDVKLMFAQWLF